MDKCSNKVEQILASIKQVLPQDMHQFKEDLDKNRRATIDAMYNRMSLVTREEFEIQKKVLARTREKLENLEHTVDEIIRSRDPS